MTIVEHPDVPTITAADAELEHLERLTQALWGSEPDCSPNARFALMTRLSSVGAELDRARVRRNADPDTAADPALLERNRRELEALSAAWISSPDASSALT